MSASSPSIDAAPKRAAPAAALAAPRLAVLVGEPLGTESALYLVSLGDPSSTIDPELGPRVARLQHRAGAAVRAVTGKGGAEATSVFVVADTEPDGDPSFAASLFRLRPGEEPKRLADRVIHASRPVASADGEVVVARGEPGVALPSTMRVDVLWIDEIDPDSGDAETLTSLEGYFLYVIGVTRREVVAYRVSPSGADLFAIDRATKAERTIVANVPPFARDFSLDPEDQTLTYLDRDTSDPVPAGAQATYVIERVDLASGLRTELHRGSSPGAVPFALPNGDVLVSLDPAKGPGTLFGPPLPLGQGVAEPAGLSSDGAFLTGIERVPGRLGRPFVLDLTRGAARFVDVPIDRRVTVAGFFGGAP
jgi:hypothetical protein